MEDTTEQMSQELERGVSKIVELSLNSVLGLTVLGTMKIKGRLGPRMSLF